MKDNTKIGLVAAGFVLAVPALFYLLFWFGENEAQKKAVARVHKILKPRFSPDAEIQLVGKSSGKIYGYRVKSAGKTYLCLVPDDTQGKEIPLSLCEETP
ncbi:MAG: hypothetical protein WC505_05975 [Patescibacteria group bacterium]